MPNSSDRTVSLSCVAAIALWSTTVLFLLAGLALGVILEGEAGLLAAGTLMAHGLACSAAAATVSIRNLLKRYTRKFQDAFDLGHEAGLRSFRRIS